MTQEDKELLLKDLYARLPYGVRLKIGEYSDYTLCGIVPNREQPVIVRLTENGREYDIDVYIKYVKPYLRPMESMTEEEKKEYKSLFSEREEEYNQGCNFFYSYTVSMYDYREISDIIDWLNAHYFDYRGLIPKGLALAAPEDMYK